MRTLAVAVLLVTLGSSVRAQQPATAAIGAADLPVSAERVSDGLQQEPLRIPPLPPPTGVTFRSAVTGQWPRETALEAMRKDLAADPRSPAAPTPPQAPGTALAPGGVNVLPAIGAAVHKIKEIRREHAEERSRRMVEDDLAAFCAEHDCSSETEADTPAEGGVIVPARVK